MAHFSFEKLAHAQQAKAHKMRKGCIKINIDTAFSI